MPWEESGAVDHRVAFIADWRAGLWTTVEWAERHGVSRKTACKGLGRYLAEGPAGLEDRPSAGAARAGDAGGAGRGDPQPKEARPSGGPRTSVAKRAERHPDLAWPSAATAGAILKRAGLVRPRHWAPPTLGGLVAPRRPNELGAADPKGGARLADGSRGEPLTVTDGGSRFRIGLQACRSTREKEARPVFAKAFAAYGRPETIRSDHGPPFAGAGVTGLTRLGVGWAKLGIRHERIASGKPPRNGRHERFHLTWNEALVPPSRDLAARTNRFAAFRDDNHERPPGAGPDHAGRALLSLAAAPARVAGGLRRPSARRRPPRAL